LVKATNQIPVCGLGLLDPSLVIPHKMGWGSMRRALSFISLSDSREDGIIVWRPFKGDSVHPASLPEVPSFSDRYSYNLSSHSPPHTCAPNSA
jgi:hypothetical protein